MPSTTPIPPYSKWYTPTPVAARTATSATPIAPGDVLADGHENRNQAPPTQGTSWEVERSFLVPWTTDEAGELKELLAKLELRYRVEDWGEVLLDGKRIIDMTPMVEKPTGSHGGHSVWTRRVNCLLSSGAHTLLFRYTNIAMDNPNNNQIIFEYDYRVVALEPGGVPMPEMCDCAGDTCSLEGGFPAAAAQAEGDGEEEGNNSPSGSVPSDSSSAGSSVQRGLGDDYAYWSCNMGTLRGLGALLTGHLQLRAATAGADLASPAALAFEHPLAAQLRLPAGGIVPGARLELQFGQRVIALRYYSDGVLAPIGVDSAGGGVATLLHDEDERVVAMRWQDGSEAQWQFDAATGELQAYTAPNGVCLSPIPELLSVRRSADGRYIRQIESPWDGLADIGNITSEGYTISLYTPARITGHDADGYAIPEPGSAYKSFVVRYAAGELSISEQSPEHPEYRCAWSQGDGGAWCMSEGSGEEAVVTERSLSTPESADTGAYAVRQRITTQRRGSAVASCVCELFQESPMGPLVLTRVEGYGSDAARTTQFEYDAVGNCTAQVAPGGHRTEYAYDSTGRLTRQSEPWHGDAGTLITYFYYSEGEGSSYRDTPSAQAVWLSPAGGELMQLLRRERYLRSEQDGVRREELRRSATGAAQERLSITERWIESAENPLARGRLRLTQGEDGVQTHYSYAATAQHGALYSMIRETKVAGAAVPGQSRRRVAYIGAAGNTLREEEYLLLSDGATWALLSGATHSYDTQNRRIGTQRDNGRNSSRTLNCTGAPLRETDENGITTTYSYDSARQLIESTRAAVYEGERCITPETITGYTRDAAGRILSERRDIGPLISIRTTQYDLLGRPIAQTDELGRTTTTTYSADGLTTCVTTPAGATLITEQHADGSLARRHGSAQREQRYVYGMQEGCLSESIRDGTTLLSQRLSDGFGQIVAEIAPTTLSNTSICTRSSYNARGQLIQQGIDGMAPTVYDYDSMGHVCRQTLLLDADAPDDASKNRIITHSIAAVEEADGMIYQVSTESRSTAAGNTLSRSEQTLLSDSAEWESKRISIDERGNSTTSLTEYGTGSMRVRKNIIPTSAITAESVVIDGFVRSQKDTAGITTTATRAYTASGMVLTQTDGRGNTTTTVTDIAGRTTSVTDAAGNVTTTVYDTAHDLPALITNAQGNTSCYRYDARGRKVAEWGTALQPACFGYDEADNMTSLTTFRAGSETISSDPTERTDGDVTTWLYDPATGLELRKTYADNSSVVKIYDAYNRLLTETDGRGVVKTHSYEQARGVLLGTTYSDGTTARAYTYNHLGQLTQVVDDAGTRTIGYNAYNEQETDSLLAGGKTHLITEFRDGYGRSSGYTYALNGSVQQTVSTGYGTDGRIASAGFIHGGAQKLFSYSYLPGTNLLQTLVKPNNMTLTQSYEETRDLLIGQLYNRSNTCVASRAYTYDTLGRPMTRCTSKDASTVNDSFGYNSRSELNTATVNNEAYTYDYDNIGNRETAQEAAESATSYESNNLNQYTAIGDFEPTYDDAGNQTTVKTTTGIWSVIYNAENRPTSFTNADNGTIVECSYDYMGRRATKKVTVNGSVTLHQRFLYRGYLQIACCDLTRSNHPCLWLITWDPLQPVATRPLAIQKDGTWYTYGWDLTKNICEVYGQHGYIRTNYTYSPYGEVTISGDVTQPIQWSSEYFDAETNLMYYNFRYYNVIDGKWNQRDPYEEKNHCNLYVYSFNRPNSFNDILGAWVGLDDLIAGAIGATIGVVSQGIIDVINRELSNASTYFAAGLGGAVGGISSLYIGPALGMGLGAATANITDRIADSLLDNGKYEGDTFCDAALDVLIDASIGLASGSIAKLIKVNGLNVKRNSWKAISQSTFTKLKNRSIHRIKSKTYFKTLGYETWQSAPFNIYNISKNTISELPNGEVITPQQYPVLDYYFFEYSSTTEIIIKTGNGIYYEKRVEYIYFEKIENSIQYNGRILVD